MIILTIFAEVVSFALCGYLILIDKRPATSKFAWLSAILFFPYIDFAFFLVGVSQVLGVFLQYKKK